jgi:hypothetical protein
MTPAGLSGSILICLIRLLPVCALSPTIVFSTSDILSVMGLSGWLRDKCPGTWLLTDDEVAVVDVEVFGEDVVELFGFGVVDRGPAELDSV